MSEQFEVEATPNAETGTGPWGIPQEHVAPPSQPASTPWGQVAPPPSQTYGAMPPPAPPAPRTGLSTGAIVAIVAGIVIVLLACCCFTGFLMTALIGLANEAGYNNEPYVQNLEDLFNQFDNGFGPDQYYYNSVPFSY